jgi:hypothetical protein
MDSTERPYSMHDLEERTCEYCGDVFCAHHGLQKYCPEKFGKKRYCLYKQKEMLNETKLATLTDILLNDHVVPNSIEGPLEKNRRVLKEIMGIDIGKRVSSDLLDGKGFDPKLYDSRYKIPDSKVYAVMIGDYSIEWVETNGDLLIFKIMKQ